jgi:ABC-type dipeptide/oligopeptide/nickel transport system permease component
MSPRYFLARFLDALLTVLAMSAVVFLAVRVLPADPALLMAGEYARPGELEAIRADLGLDQSIPRQYGRWLSAAITGNLGRSIRTRQPVSQIFVERVPATLELAFLALLLGVALGLPLGVLAALGRNSPLDKFIRILAVTTHSTPNFFLGLVLVLVFAVILGWLPAVGDGGWRHFILPTVTLSTYVTALVTRIVRASMLDVLAADYIRTAHAKGLPRRSVIWRHGMRNALLPVVTIVGLHLGTLIGGAIVTETVFAWPGIGSAAYQAILERDYPVIQAIVLYVAVGVVCVNVLVDLVYAALQPQIRFA